MLPLPSLLQVHVWIPNDIRSPAVSPRIQSLGIYCRYPLFVSTFLASFIYRVKVRPSVEHSMEESFPRPWPNTTPLPQQQLPNSKCPNTSATNLQASEASNDTASHGTARVSQACGFLNNDIRQTIPPRSNSPSLVHFRSSTQRRLLTLGRPWHVGRHLRRPR